MLKIQEKEFLESKKYKVLFIPTLNKTVVYHRMEKFVNEMREDKDMSVAFYDTDLYDVDTCQWEWNLQDMGVLKELYDLCKIADVIVFQYVHSHRACAFIQMVRDELNKYVICEIDDDPFSISGKHPYFKTMAPGSLPELWTTDHIQLSNEVVTTTDYLKSRIKKKNKHVYVAPNTIDFDVWDKLEQVEPNGKITIGWAGGGNHDEDLELLEAPINHVLDSNENVEFVLFVGNEAPKWCRRKNIRIYDTRSWKSIYDYPKFLKSLNFDIGVAPLRDREFNRAKSNLKWLEYSALKIPTVTSPVTPYIETTALKARTTQEWIYCLNELIRNKQEREYLGNQSYKAVKRLFDSKKIAKKYSNHLKKIIDGLKKKGVRSDKSNVVQSVN